MTIPRCRFGYFHAFNNDYDGWVQSAIGGSAAPTILSQGNRFRASGSVKEVNSTLTSSYAKVASFIIKKTVLVFLP